MRTHDEHGNMIDDEAITVFTKALDSLPKDEWRARTLAFEALIESLPGPGSSTGFIGSGIIPWYKSFTALRRLVNPISSLMLNARSTVVKHTGQHLAFLIQRIKDLNPPNADTAKYLLKDLLPSVLALHAQTSNIIRSYGIEMMTIIIPLCRFKSGLPVLLERLRKDKSRDVREGCVRYLKLIVKYWAPEKPGQDTPLDQEYLTPNICKHIGNGLARAMMDGAQSVRTEARNAFELFRHKYPDLWNQIVQKKDGILSKDQRLKKSIMNAALKADADGSPEGNNYYPSFDDADDYDTRTLGSNKSSSSVVSWNSNSSFVSKSSRMSGSTRSKLRSNSRPRALHGPSRKSNGNLPPSSKRVPTTTPFGKVTTPERPKKGDRKHIPIKSSLLSSKEPNEGSDESENLPPSRSSSSSPSDEQHSASSITNKISSVPKTVMAKSKPSENYMVSNQLLAAHKSYIDDLMESLRTEMNTIRDFESLLVNAQNNPDENGTYGPSEDDVLKYYESVYSYLDKGMANSTKLRHEMERIGRTEFQS